MSKKLPEGWKKFKLGELFTITSGGTPSRKNSKYYENGNIPWVKTGDLKQKYIDNSSEYITTEAVENSSAKYFPKSTVLIAMYGATIGATSILRIDATTNQACAAFLPNDSVLPEYLYYYFRRNKDSIINLGVGGAQPNISATILKNINIDLPPLEEQERVVSILERAEAAIHKREESLSVLEELIKSRFIKMFGSPSTNSMGWDIDVIGSVVKSITAGWSANGEVREKRESEKAVLKVSAVTQGYFKPNEYKVIDNSVEIKKYVYPQKGDLLFSRANTREMVGATCIIHKDYPDLLLPDKLWKVLFNDRVNVFYMKYILSESSIRAKFSASSTGTSGSMYNVSMDKFKGIEIPVPPIELQNQFVDFVKQVDKLKVEMEKSLNELQNNFNSLMQRAFNGEL